MASATRDFEELLGAFLRREVRFVIVGAHALAHHAKPRYTKDLDLFVQPSPENALLIVEALEESGSADWGLPVRTSSSPAEFCSSEHPPTESIS
jgi:hypothetical protein